MKIVFAFADSDSARNALEIIQKHARKMNASIDIVASLIAERFLKQGDARIEADEVREAGMRLEFAKQKLSQEGIVCKTHLLPRGLQPGEDIVKYATDVNADFIVLGIDRTSRVGKMIFGSIAQYVILEAACPVITVK
jgi:nucleotide-binding universal stress UspA family protein